MAEPLDPFVNTAWCLVFSMIECGFDGTDPWWGQDFLHLKNLLAEKGLNMNPMRVEIDLDAPNVLSGPKAHELIGLLERQAGAALASYRHDTDRDVFYIGISDARQTCDMDEHEIFIFRATEDDTISAIVIPHYASYWLKNPEELERVLNDYVPGLGSDVAKQQSEEP